MKYNHVNFDQVESAYTQALSAISLEGNNFAVQYAVAVSTPSAGTFTVTLGSPNTLTKSAHGMTLGLKVRVSSATTLPGGLASATDYYVIPLSADSFMLASSLANAQAGTAITITNAGTGAHTVTPTSLAGASIKMQESVDGQNWYDISGATANITVGVTAKFDGTSKCGQIRPYLTLTAGQLQVTIKADTKE